MFAISFCFVRLCSNRFKIEDDFRKCCNISQTNRNDMGGGQGAEVYGRFYSVNSHLKSLDFLATYFLRVLFVQRRTETKMKSVAIHHLFTRNAIFFSISLPLSILWNFRIHQIVYPSVMCEVMFSNGDSQPRHRALKSIILTILCQRWVNTLTSVRLIFKWIPYFWCKYSSNSKQFVAIRLCK